MTERIPLLLDTDPGSDIDDAVAIAYLLRQPRCELLGVTTVTGDVAKRAAIVDVLCREMGRTDVPIHAGASDVLLWGPGQPHVPHYDAVRDLPHRTDFRPNAAVDFLRETIRARPNEITLLSIGPFTNVATLFALDPEIPSLLRDFVSMAGVFFDPDNRLEWNCRVDPVATAMVYRARPPRHTSIGLDVTTRCTMEADEVARRFTPKPLNLVAKMAQVWFGNAKRMTFHDPLAAATIFHPGLCGYDDGEVRIVIDPKAEKTGETHFHPAKGGSAAHRVAQAVDAPAFFEEFFGVFA